MEITKDMTIGDVVAEYPSSVQILMDEGVHCVGCGAAFMETIEQGLKGHGMDDAKIEEILKKLNEGVKEDEELKGKDLAVTKKAAEQLKHILKEQKKENFGMRIIVSQGGCSGMQYGFNLEEKEKEGDHVFEESGVKFFVDDESFSLVKGVRIDYREGAHGAGFSITNPSAKSSCGCGN